MRAKNPKKATRSAPKGSLHLFSDFDNTMIRENSAATLVSFYFWNDPHKEPLMRRFKKIALLATGNLRRKFIRKYYDVLRRIPAKDRQRVLAGLHVRKRWLQAVKDARLKHKSKQIDLTIVSRNSIDVVHDWVMQNRDVLRENRIRIEGIIANGSLKDEDLAFVRERADFKHIDYVGFGQLMTEQKKQFVDKKSVYIGDAEDELLHDVVDEYIRV